MTELDRYITLSRTFFALADPTRRAILARPAEGAATVKELAAPFRTLKATPLREASAFTDEFRRFWDEPYARLDAYLEVLQARRRAMTRVAGTGVTTYTTPSDREVVPPERVLTT